MSQAVPGLSTAAPGRAPGKIDDVTRRAMIEAQIESLIAYLDILDGDPDTEADDEDCCCAGDDCGGQYCGATMRGDGYAGDPEDAEDDLEDCCAARDDAGGRPHAADWGGDGWPGDPEDAERDFMPRHFLMMARTRRPARSEGRI